MIFVKSLVTLLELPQFLVSLQQLPTCLACCVTLGLNPQLEQSWCHCWPPAVPHQKVLQIVCQAPNPAILETKL